MSTEESWNYQSESGQVAGPVNSEKLAALVSKGNLGAEDKIKPVDSEEWTTVANSVFQKQLSSSPPDLPNPPKQSPQSNEIDWNDTVNKFKDLGRTLLACAIRAFSGNFHGEIATQQEQAKLSGASTPVTEPAIINFLAWRRSALGMGAALLILSFLFSIPQMITSFETRNMPTFIHLTTVIFILSSLVTIGLIILALLTWANYQLSRLLARFAFVTGFLVPFAVYLIPVRWFISSSDKLGTTGWATLAGVSYAASLLPLVISIFPAFLRSALIMKSLIPESTLPGWIALMIAPFNALFFLVGLVVTMQIGDVGGIIAFSALTAAPLVILVFILPLVRPADTDNAQKRITKVRFCLLICYVVALLGFSAFLFNWQNATFSGVAQSVFTIIANVFVFNIVFGDYFLNLIRFSFEEEERLREGPLHASLRKRIQQTSQLQAKDSSKG